MELLANRSTGSTVDVPIPEHLLTQHNFSFLRILKNFSANHNSIILFRILNLKIILNNKEYLKMVFRKKFPTFTNERSF